MVCLPGMTIPILSHFISINLAVVQESHHEKQRHFDNSGNSKNLEVASQEPGTKSRILYNATATNQLFSEAIYSQTNVFFMALVSDVFSKFFYET